MGELGQNNKYYTPTIEEFHVGFECEIFGRELPPQFHKTIISPALFNNCLQNYNKKI